MAASSAGGAGQPAARLEPNRLGLQRLFWRLILMPAVVIVVVGCQRSPVAIDSDGSVGPRQPITCSGWTKLDSRTLQETYGPMWGTGPNDVYILLSTANKRGAVLRYDGKTVVRLHTTLEEPTAIWGTDASNLYVGTTTSLLHHDGKTWKQIKLPVSQLVNGIWGSSPSKVYVVGSWVNRFDGKTWSVVHKGDQGETFTSVHGAGGELFVAGYESAISNYPIAGFIYSFDGQSWSKTLDVPVTAFRAVWADGSTAIVAGDTRVTYGYKTNGRVYAFAGGAWKLASLPLDKTEKTFLYTVWGSSRQRIFVGGLYNLLAFNGETWNTIQPPGTHHSFLGVWGIGSTLFASAYEWNGLSTLWRATCTM
jgi:hypothetical protein